ncbi:MAG TPA: lysoplasmalogenase, partial [Candidatus Paceibacterota bacterium]|nr:lysoplasmalogenase [Candidatus Paceibacterota bacterium]
ATRYLGIVPSGLSGWLTPLTTCLILVLAVAARPFADRRYRWGIIIGLGFSIGGDTFLMLPGDHFLAGLASFLVAHLFYLWALTSGHRMAASRVPFVIWAFIGTIVVLFLWPGIDVSLRWPVIIYAGVLLAMAAQAASRAMTAGDAAAWAAAVGGAFFVASDMLLAVRKFHGPIPAGHVLVLGTYFLAQWFIALSLVCRRSTIQPEAGLIPSKTAQLR